MTFLKHNVLCKAEITDQYPTMSAKEVRVEMVSR